jgi:hypothetical protein
LILIDTLTPILKEETQKIFHGGEQRQKFSGTVAPNQCQAMLITCLEVHTLLKVSKTGGILAKTHTNVF